MGFSRKEYWSGLSCPPPGDLPNPGIEPGLPHCRQFLYRLSHQGSPIGKLKAGIRSFFPCSASLLSPLPSDSKSCLFGQRQSYWPRIGSRGCIWCGLGAPQPFPRRSWDFPSWKAWKRALVFLGSRFQKGEGLTVVVLSLTTWGKRAEVGRVGSGGERERGGRKWMVTESVPVLDPLLCSPYSPSGIVLICLVCPDTVP